MTTQKSAHPVSKILITILLVLPANLLSTARAQLQDQAPPPPAHEAPILTASPIQETPQFTQIRASQNTDPAYKIANARGGALPLSGRDALLSPIFKFAAASTKPRATPLTLPSTSVTTFVSETTPTPAEVLASTVEADIAATLPVIPATPVALPLASTPVTPSVPRDANGIPFVTNVFVETDLKQALADISAQTGIVIIADNTVQGAVSADLKDVSLDVALAMMLQTGGYSLAKLDGYYLVGMPDPANPNFYLFSQTEIVELNHISPRTVLDLLAIPYGRYLSAENFAPAVTEINRDGTSQAAARRSVGLGRGTGQVQRLGVSSPSVNLPPESDRISITAPPNLIARIKKDIASLDQPRTQVMLEAVVLEISEEALKEIGLDFTTRFLAGSLLSGASNLTYTAIGSNDTAQLTALVRNGTARLRANPRVSTAEGQTAEIEVGRENYFEIDTGNNSLSFATLEVIKSGILLRITPKVLEATGEVMARIEPEVRDVTGQSSNGLPEITFRRAATNMRVRDGESIVIGGLINEFTNVTKSKIPILGDLPLVGGIFRGTNSRKVKTEVVIVITPRILTDGAPDGVHSRVLQNDLSTYRAGEPWEPFAFPNKR